MVSFDTAKKEIVSAVSLSPWPLDSNAAWATSPSILQDGSEAERTRKRKSRRRRKQRNRHARFPSYPWLRISNAAWIGPPPSKCGKKKRTTTKNLGAIISGEFSSGTLQEENTRLCQIGVNEEETLFHSITGARWMAKRKADGELRRRRRGLTLEKPMTDSIPLGRARPDSLFLLRRTPEDGCEHCVSAPRDAILELFPGSEELIRLDHRRTFSSELSHIRKKLNIMVLASLPVTRGGIIYRVAASTEALRRAFCLHFVPPKGDAILFTFRPRQISLPRVPDLID